MIRAIWIFGLSMFFSLYGMAQFKIEGQLLNADSGLPIPDAHVFLINSSHGNTSDEEGIFSLNVDAAGSYEIGFTHINYEPQFQELQIQSDQQLKIYLKPSVLIIEEIQVTAKASRKRKRFLNQFRNALLGQSPFTANCIIENPEVLRFEDLGAGVFSAKATDLLTIQNPDLGYVVHLYLEDFKKENLTIHYGVKVYFETMRSTDPEQLALWKNNRRLAYDGSKRHFLESLLEKNWAEEGFHMNHIRITPNNELEIIRAARESEIIQRKNGKTFLSIPNALAVLYNQGVKGSLAAWEGQKSYLVPQQSWIDITNPLAVPDNELVELGYWSKLGIASWLPSDYRTVYKFEQEVPLMNQIRLTDLTIPLEAILRGGPPKDGIRAIDNPQFETIDADNSLDAQDRMIVVHHKSRTKAYPLKSLRFHLIVNDIIEDDPLIVTYCPLSNASRAYRTKKYGKEMTFGVSGLVYQSNFLMYDRMQELLWTQLDGRAINGKMSGEQLIPIPVEILSFQSVQKLYPGCEVWKLNRVNNRYNTNPYQHYHSSKEPMFPIAMVDPRLEPKEMILGISVNGVKRAYPMDLMRQHNIREDILAGKRLHFEYLSNQKDMLVKDELNQPIQHIRCYWFAWKALHPETDLYIP